MLGQRNHGCVTATAGAARGDRGRARPAGQGLPEQGNTDGSGSLSVPCFLGITQHLHSPSDISVHGANPKFPLGGTVMTSSKIVT